MKNFYNEKYLKKKSKLLKSSKLKWVLNNIFIFSKYKNISILIFMALAIQGIGSEIDWNIYLSEDEISAEEQDIDDNNGLEKFQIQRLIHE